MPGRLVGSIPFIATLVVAALGVGALTSTARAKDCLAAPNSPAPDGSWWYYRLDWPTQRKCWYLRALGRPAQQATERERTGSGPVRSRPARSESTRPTDRALESVSTDDNSAPSPPDADTAPVGSIVPEAPAPQASTSAPPSAPTVPPTQNNEQVIQQSAREESATNSLLERPVQETSASSQTNAQAPAPVDAADVATPDAVPRIEALESNAVSTDASAASEPDYIDLIERAERIREQASYEQAPIRFFVIAVGLAVIGISFHFVRRRRFAASSLNHSRQTRS